MMFRRPRRPVMRRAIARNVRRQFFAEADQLSASGQPEQAARQFSDMAVQMEREGKLRQAANLHAQAAHRWLDAHNKTNALQESQTALTLFNRMNMQQRAAEFNARFSAHLQEHGMQMETGPAAQTNLSEPATTIQPEAKRVRGQLPAICPQCGAPVHSNEVAWLDDASAECDFCGSGLQAM